MIQVISQVTPSPWCLWRSDTGRRRATRIKPFACTTKWSGTCRTVGGDDELAVCRELARREGVAAPAGEE